MNKLIESLRETLLQLGLDENAVNAALEEAIAKATVEEETPSVDPTQEPNADQVPPLPPQGESTDGNSDVPPSNELPPDDVVPPDGEQVPPQEPVPPIEPPVPPVPAVPPFDPTELFAKIDEVQSANAELQKANEGLIARVQALEEALKNAGVIDGSNPVTQVGDPLPSAAPQNPTDDVFGNVLSELNGHKRF